MIVKVVKHVWRTYEKDLLQMILEGAKILLITAVHGQISSVSSSRQHRVALMDCFFNPNMEFLTM